MNTEVSLIIICTILVALLALTFLSSGKECVILLTGESFTVSNCAINSDLVELVKEQQNLFHC